MAQSNSYRTGAYQMNGYTVNKIKDTIWKTLVLVFGIAFIAFIVYYRLDRTSSKFNVYQDNGTVIFIDKYVSKKDDLRFRTSWKTVINDFLEKTKLSAAVNEKNKSYYPEVIFFVDNFYSTIALDDPHIEKYLKDKPGGDFQLLQKARMSIFFDSLISHSYTSADGRYIFFSNAENLESDLVYAYTFGIISYNMPESARKQLRIDSNWDFYSYTAWIMLEEMAAISTQQIQKAFSTGKTLEEALETITNLPSDYYTNENSSVIKKEEEYIALSFREPDKPARIYQTCLDMAKHLIAVKGKNDFMVYLADLFTGNYTTIGELIQQDLKKYIDPVVEYYSTGSRKAQIVEDQTRIVRSAPASQ